MRDTGSWEVPFGRGSIDPKRNRKLKSNKDYLPKSHHGITEIPKAYLKKKKSSPTIIL